MKLKEFINTIIGKITIWFLSNNVQYEIKSSFATFCAIFAGTIVLNPIFKEFVGLDLPTINNIKDILPVVVDTAYRSLWGLFLVKFGLSYRK